MSGDGEPRRGRYHLVLSVELWETLVAEASRRRMRVSHLVQVRLAASLGIREGGGVPLEVSSSQPVERGRRHHCRLSVDSLIWNRLAHEAAKRRVSVTEVVRRCLREAVLGRVPEMQWEEPSGPAYGRFIQDTGSPKSITMYDL